MSSTDQNQTTVEKPHQRESRSQDDLRAPSFPNRVTVELTNACNLKCPMCPRHFMDGHMGYMAWDMYVKIIDEMSAHLGTAMVPFFRGESMLHPKFIEMMAYAKKKGVGPIQYTTNATRMKPKFARALVDLKIDFVSFSVDSIDPEKYAAIRINGKLEETLANIDYFCKYKAEQNSAFPEVQVSVVKTKQTEDSIKQFVDFWTPKVDRVRVYEEHSTGGTFGALEDNTDPMPRMACHKVFGDLVIYWDGTVGLCNHDWVRTELIDSVADKSIAEVWLGERYEKIRQAHLKNHDQLEKVCQGCDHWKLFYLDQNRIGDLYEAEYDI